MDFGGVVSGYLLDLKGNLQCLVQHPDLLGREGADVIGQCVLGNAYQLITVDRAVMLQSLIGSDRELR